MVIGIKLTSTTMSITIQEEISWTGTLIAPFCVFTVMLTSSIVDMAFIDIYNNHKKTIIKCQVICKMNTTCVKLSERVVWTVSGRNIVFTDVIVICLNMNWSFCDSN